MTALTDPRPIATSGPVWINTEIQSARLAAEVGDLIDGNPDLELASLRIVVLEQRPDSLRIEIVARVGTLTEPECDCYSGGFSPETYEGPQHHCRVHGHGPDCCSSCHAAGGHPHTEYCQLVDHASQLTYRELYGPAD